MTVIRASPAHETCFRPGQRPSPASASAPAWVQTPNRSPCLHPPRDATRLDGVLYERHTLNKAHHAAVVSRIKVMAKLNIAEKRLPQDGRIAISLGGRQAGLRVSTLPTSFGERVVLRLLEKSERVLSLTELGLSRD